MTRMAATPSWSLPERVDMGLSESQSKHFEPVYLPTWGLIVALGAVAIVTVILNLLVLDTLASVVLVSAGGAFAILSAFLAGNMYRLGDTRARMGLQARLTGETQIEILARLPPLRIVRFRFKVAMVGFGIAALMLVASVLTVPFSVDAIRPIVASAALGVAASGAAFVCGLWSRPID